MAATLALLSPLLLHGATALMVSGFGGYGDPWNDRTGPYNANNSAFLEAVESSNASAIFKMPGYDVSKPYPGAPIDGWTFSVTALDFSTFDYQRADSRTAMIGYSMTIKAPDSLLADNLDGTKKVNVDPSWGMCMWTWSPPHHTQKALWNNRENKPLSEDGSCDGFLSKECISALEKLGLDRSSVVLPNETRSAYGSLAECGSFPIPDECGKDGPGNSGGESPVWLGVPIPYLNGSVTNSDGWEFEQDVGGYYNTTQDLRDYWDSYVLNYWPIMTVMVNVTVDEVTPFYKRKGGMARMSCVAPNGVGTGKGFSFSGVVPANAAGTDQKEEAEKETPKDSGTGVVSVGRVFLSVVVAYLVILSV